MRTALVLPLLALLACKPGGALDGDSRGGSDLPPAPAPPHAIEILMAGKPPHEALRFVAGDAKEQRIVVQHHYSKYGPDPTGLKNSSDSITLVARIAPGEHQGSYVGTIGTLLEEVDEFAPVTRVEVGPRGPIGAFEPLGKEPTWLPGVLERLMTALPEDAVGEGAVWQTVVADALGEGHDLRVTYELVDLDHGVWHLKGDSGAMPVATPQPVDGKAPPQPQPTTRPDAIVQGEFEIWWRPASPLPHLGRVKENRTVYDADGADVEVIELVLGEPGQTTEDIKGGW